MAEDRGAEMKEEDKTDDSVVLDGQHDHEPKPGTSQDNMVTKKKSKKRKKKKGGESTAAAGDADQTDDGFPLQKLQEVQRALQQLSVHQQPKNVEDARDKKYEFWDTQPVPKIGEEVRDYGAIEADKPQSEVRQDPYSLPQGFEWDTLDISKPDVLSELYVLLNENYVEDDDNMFRFDYSKAFLLWALKPPGWLLQWHCGVRVVSNKKLVGFISAVPAAIRIKDHLQKMVEINFLCVHKKLRSKRVAPVLIREITRRVHQQGLFQAVYTAGVVLPRPVAKCRYWHRSLNPKKLIEVKFSHLSRNMTMQRTIKLYKLPDEPKTQGLRPMVKSDVPQVHSLLSEHLKKFQLSPVFSVEEFEHWFLPREGIIDSFVVEEEAAGEKSITDFISFYTLPSTIMHHPQYSQLKAAYSFYNVHTKHSLLDIMNDALILAKQRDFDVFNALDLMQNKEFLEQLKFGIGDGNLQYYLYNYRCPEMSPNDVGLVLQ